MRSFNVFLKNVRKLSS